MLPPQTCNKLDSFRQGLSDSRCRILKAAPSWSPSLPPWAARKTRLLPPWGQRKYHPRSWGCLKKGIRQTFSLTEPCPCNYFDINPLGDENRVAASGKSVSSKPYSFLPESKDIGRMPCLGIGRIPTALRSAVMEESNRACYVHYNHADPCSAARWTAKESYEFMYGRPWQTVSDFYSELVRGGGYALLASLFPTEQKHESQELTENFEGWEDKKSASVSTNKTGRWARVTFKIILSYHGKSFEGWQKQPGLDTVQSLVEKSLGKFVDEKKAQHLRSQSLPVDGCAVVAGRTDKGVTALQQVCSFYTWRKDVTKGDIEDAINNAAPGKLRALYISEVSRVFHPNFSAKWRRYLYIFPLSSGQEDQTSRSEGDSSITSDDSNDNYEDEQVRYDKEDDGMVTIWNTAEDENYYSARKARNFSISKMNQLLRQLEGKCLSYRMFARDTKASRSIGPPTECFMFHARATETGLPCANEAYNGQRVMCVELVANRFLRKMVRVLVATAIREAAAGADDDALIKLMDATCRRATAPPAPPDGLCLVDVGYGDFKQEYCLIL